MLKNSVKKNIFSKVVSLDSFEDIICKMIDDTIDFLSETRDKILLIIR